MTASGLWSGLRSFRDGLRLSLLWEYLKSFKDSGWEIFWGATLPSILFGIYIIFYTPTTVTFLCYLLLVFFFTGYNLWKADHMRLVPRIAVKEWKIEKTPTTSANESRTYVQLLPKCLSDVPVSSCQGHLLRVYHRDSGSQEWQLTAMNEPIDLEWSIYGYGQRIIHPGAEPRLNVCYVRLSMQEKRMRQIVPTVRIWVLRWNEVFASDGLYRFDVRITAENCSPVDVSVAVSIPPDRPSDQPLVEILSPSAND